MYSETQKLFSGEKDNIVTISEKESSSDIVIDFYTINNIIPTIPHVFVYQKTLSDEVFSALDPTVNYYCEKNEEDQMLGRCYITITYNCYIENIIKLTVIPVLIFENAYI